MLVRLIDKRGLRGRVNKEGQLERKRNRKNERDTESRKYRMREIERDVEG